MSFPTKKIMFRHMSLNKCQIGVLTIDQFDTLIQREKHDILVKEKIKNIYKKTRKLYINICKICQMESTGSEEEESLLLKDAKSLSTILREKNEWGIISPILTDALTLMFCRNRNKCINHERWPKHLDTHFLNWLSHRMSEMGNDTIGVRQSDIDAIRDDDYILNNTREVLSIPLLNKLNNINFCKSIKIAKECYMIDGEFRRLRHPRNLSYEPICGEQSNSSHIFRQNLANALGLVLDEWIDEDGEECRENKKMRHA